MKVLFVYTNITGYHADTYAFGLASILSCTRAAGHECKIVVVQEKEKLHEVIDAFDEFQPKVVGFSSVSSQYHFVKQLSKQIKERVPSTITVCGGVHTTINPDTITECNTLDGVFRGDCEDVFVEFLEKIEKNEAYWETDNYVYIKDGKVIKNQMRPYIKDLDTLPFPDRDLYPLEYQVSTGNAPFFFSRGCPYLCTYCANHAIARTYGLKKSITRYRSPESSIQEIEACLKKVPNIDTVYIEDDIFGINKEWRNEFCRIYAERISIRFNVLLRVNLVDEEFLKLLKKAGCYQITFGVESGNDYIRNKVMKRHMTNEKIIDVFDLTHSYGIRTCALNIIGAPGETEEMLWDTINLNKRIKPFNSGCNIFYPYKGTDLGDYSFDNGLVDVEAYNDFSNERRESVMNYPDEWKKKLVYYRDNWETLIYGFDFKKALKKEMQKTIIWKPMLRMKRKMTNLMLHSKAGK